MTKQILFLILIFLSFLLNSCERLDSVSYSPLMTPENFLIGQHWMKIDLGFVNFVFSQPSSSFFVYFLSFFYIYVGYKFWTDTRNQKSRFWWAIGFFLTGIAAILAGTSYQAFGYEIKCNGRTYCTWTSLWEIVYEILQGAGMNGFLMATAYTNARGHFRKSLIYYAFANTIIYTILVLYGAFVPIQFLISFEFLELSCLPAVIYFLWSSTLGYVKAKDKLNLYLRNTWLILIVVIIAYIAFMKMGFSGNLWQNGIWFTENDVLHVGLIYWVYYILKKLPNEVKDLV